MHELKATEVRMHQHSEELMAPGDAVFVAKREAKRTVEKVQLEPPVGILERLWWYAFGKKHEMREVVELLWPEFDALIVNCPSCGQPCATNRNHKILSLDPVTVELPITCPYCKTFTFAIEANHIKLANG